MRGKVVPTIAFALIFLALFGFGYKMVSDPAGLMRSLVYIVAFAALISAAFYFLFYKRRQGAAPSSDMKKYKQAVKQSQQKYKKNTTPASVTKPKKVTQIKKRTPRKRPSHLRVIEGQKTEKKNRALF